MHEGFFIGIHLQKTDIGSQLEPRNINKPTSTCSLIISLALTNAPAPEITSRTETTPAVLQIIMELAKATENANPTKTAPLTFEVWREAESREGAADCYEETQKK